MSRIALEDTTMSTVIKLAEGNPGAMMAMTSILNEYDAIDPQSAFGGLGVLLDFDQLGIYGSSIYVLFNDKCNRSVRQLVVLLRGYQLGFLKQSVITEMAADQMRRVNLSDEEWADLDAKVCDTLEDFKRVA